MNFFSTLRGQLSVVLGLLLVLTVGVQYYLNLRTQEENINLTEMQEQALLAGFALGVNSMTSRDRLQDFVKREGQSFYNDRTKRRIMDIFVIDNDWQIYDSLSGRYLPEETEDGEFVSKDLRDVRDLPPLTEGKEKLGDDIVNFPNAGVERVEGDDEAHAIPVETDQGRFYVMILLSNDRQEAARRAIQPLIFTISVFLVAILITLVLVWRFTMPIANLSKAARRVGRGDLSFRLQEPRRWDEIGALTTQFNTMTEELEESRKLEVKLREAEKSAVVGRLASAIAHEIRNPLNFINLTLDHLRNKFKPADAEREETFDKLTSQLKTEVERINRQITDFLSYSRPVRLIRVPLDLRSVVEGSLKIIEPQAVEQGVKISLVERDPIPNALGDKELLRSVFNNLFINSLQAMELSGGMLSIALYSDEESVSVEVKDTGGGIPPEHVEKVFEPYFSTKETGTGLGLAIVKRIVDEHGGSLELESEAGKGTTFTIRLDAARLTCPKCGERFEGMEKCPTDGTVLEKPGWNTESEISVKD